MNITAIAAVGLDGTIGKNGDLPWKLPDDLKFFKEETQGSFLIVGRKTFESFGAKPLPRRMNAVITRKGLGNIEIPSNLMEFSSINGALAHAKRCGDKNVFIGGGSEIYRQGIKYADFLYITWVNEFFNGDTFFPPQIETCWTRLSFDSHSKDENHSHSFSIAKYKRLESAKEEIF